MPKPITKASVEQFLLLMAGPVTMSDLEREFITDSSRHRKRFLDVIEKLVNEGKVHKSTGPSALAKMAPLIAILSGASRSEYFYHTHCVPMVQP